MAALKYVSRIEMVIVRLPTWDERPDVEQGKFELHQGSWIHDDTVELQSLA
jgi:hypothetical protein